MWCLVPVAIDINGLWTHLELELVEEGFPEKKMDRGPRVEKPIGWRIQLGLELGKLGKEVAVDP